MTTLSSAVVPETVGFWMLVRRVRQATVVVPVSIDELIVAVNVPGVREKPSTVMNTNAPPLWLEPLPLQAARRSTNARVMREWRPRNVSGSKECLIAASPAPVPGGGCSGGYAGPSPDPDVARGPAGRFPGPRWDPR